MATVQGDVSAFTLHSKRIAPGPGHSVLVFYERSEWEQFLPWIEQALGHSFIDIGSVVDLEPGLNFEIALIDHAHFKHKVTGAPWVTAAYHRGRIFIPIHSEKYPEAQKLRDTIAHEYMHAIVDDVSNGEAPGWLDEGLALLAEGSQQRGATRSFYTWIRDNRLIPLASLQDGYTRLDKENATYAYIQSREAVTYLLENYGRRRLGILLRKIGSGTGFNAAFVETYLLRLATFETNLEQELKSRARARL